MSSTPSSIPATPALVVDAKNRALRVFLQGLAVDVAVGVSALVLSSVDEITSKAGLIAFGLSLVKTMATSAAAFVMRRWVDRSSFPTPLPPEFPGNPSE